MSRTFCNANKQTNKLHGLSPWANYTDRATAASRRSNCQLLRIKGATWSAWRVPMAVFSFSRQEPLLFYQVAPQLYSRGWVDPVPDPLFFFDSAGNRTRASGSVAKNSDLDHRGGHSVMQGNVKQTQTERTVELWMYTVLPFKSWKKWTNCEEISKMCCVACAVANLFEVLTSSNEHSLWGALLLPTDSM
jgi:hypothetical protein